MSKKKFISSIALIIFVFLMFAPGIHVEARACMEDPAIIARCVEGECNERFLIDQVQKGRRTCTRDEIVMNDEVRITEAFNSIPEGLRGATSGIYKIKTRCFVSPDRVSQCIQILSNSTDIAEYEEIRSEYVRKDITKNILNFLAPILTFIVSVGVVYVIMFVVHRSLKRNRNKSRLTRVLALLMISFLQLGLALFFFGFSLAFDIGGFSSYYLILFRALPVIILVIMVVRILLFILNSIRVKKPSDY